MMICLLLILTVVTVLLGIGFKLTGALLAALFWLCIKLPIACLVLALAIIFCCTIILIPVGIALFKVGIGLLIPCC